MIPFYSLKLFTHVGGRVIPALGKDMRRVKISGTTLLTECLTLEIVRQFEG